MNNKIKVLKTVGLLTGVWMLGLTHAAKMEKVPQYPYASKAFDALVDDSFQRFNAHPLSFEAWLEAAYLKNPAVQMAGMRGKSLPEVLKRQGEVWAQTRPQDRTKLEKELATWAFWLTKKLIPKFSLTTGVEFRNAAVTGERQCLLQSTLIASLLQKMGLPAGAVMVWKNPQGTVSNLGHVTVLLNLSNGHQLLVDASDPEPFVSHQGIFTRDLDRKSLQFLAPQYASDHEITGYQHISDPSKVTDQQVRPLTYNYVRSQFYYYRAERTPGGVLGKASPQGLKNALDMMKQSLQYAPENPLSTYVMGHIYRKMGEKALARESYQKGLKLYQQYGFVPQGPLDAVKGL